MDLQVDALVGDSFSIHNKGCACIWKHTAHAMHASWVRLPLCVSVYCPAVLARTGAEKQEEVWTSQQPKDMP